MPRNSSRWRLAGVHVTEFSRVDILALAYFLSAWATCNYLSDRRGGRADNLIGVMAEQRVAWMRQTLDRDSRAVSPTEGA